MNFYAISYILFKHGSKTMMRKSKLVSSMLYIKLMAFLIVMTHIVSCGFTGSTGFIGMYYYGYFIIISPIQLFILALMHKDFAYNFLYRLFGHYYMNFTFHLV